MRKLGAYSAAKAAVIGYVRALAADLDGTGVTANAICPGSTRGAMLEASAAVYGLPDQEKFAEQQLTRRLLEHYASRQRAEALDPRLADLTHREVEVARLVAAGLSNAEIGRTLFLSEATVKTYVSRLLAKLGVRDRVQLTVLAYESGLVVPGES